MKKTVSIKFQNYLSFIPYLNVSILFIWVYNSCVVGIDNKVWAKSLLVLFVTIIPFGLLQLLLLQTTNSIANDIAIVIGYYLMPLAMARGLIVFQKKLKITH